MSKKECLDDMFLNRISIIVGQEDENQIKQEIEQIGYKEFYRYNQEKRYMIEQQKIEIKNKEKEIERLNNIIKSARNLFYEKCRISQHGAYIFNEVDYEELSNILGSDKK